MKRFFLNRLLSLVSVLFLAAQSVALVGCLDTRAGQKEQEEKQVLRKTVANLQQSTADVNARFQGIEDDVRKIDGRVEAVEARMAQSSSKADKSSTEVETKLKENDAVYREEFQKMTSEIEQLKSAIAALQDEHKRAGESRAAGAKASAKGPFEAAESKFEEKNWQEAILDYEKYRKANPKGKQFPTATYKIGVAFQELGMADDAKAFYDEVVAKFPKSKDAEKAKSRLKGLKK